MNRNQKIALGCGGLGCLGLIVLGIAGTFFYLSYQRQPRVYVNDNSNRGRDSSSNRNTNSNSSKLSSMSEENKHRLFQAASGSKDAELVVEVSKKIGIVKSNGTPGDSYPGFIRDHVIWAIKNTDFIASIDTPEKARAYVETHMSDQE
jgi:hypothetical protein